MNSSAQLLAGFHLRRLLLPCAVLLGVVLLSFAVLRETPDFWRNAGGYPLWLRELVLAGFLPLLIGDYGLLLFLAGLLLTRPSQSVRRWWMETGILALACLLLAATVAVALANNTSNLLDGKPLHTHATH